MIAMRSPPIADMPLDAYAAAVGQPALVTSSVLEVTRRPARSFREWATDHAGDFATYPAQPQSDRSISTTARFALFSRVR
jgi:hypothetical protein